MLQKTPVFGPDELYGTTIHICQSSEIEYTKSCWRDNMDAPFMKE